MRKVIDNKNKNSQPKLRVEDFLLFPVIFLRWVLFYDRAPALPTCATSPLTNALHFVAYSDMWE